MGANEKKQNNFVVQYKLIYILKEDNKELTKAYYLLLKELIKG